MPPRRIHARRTFVLASSAAALSRRLEADRRLWRGVIHAVNLRAD
jgi:hypothetical protein